MLCSPVLLQMKPFQALPPERLDWICERAEHISLKAGEVLAREGDPPQGFFIQVQGQTTVSRKSNGVDMPIGQNDSPAFFGEIQVLTHDPLPVTFTANVDTELYRLKCPDFLDVLHSCREFERDIFRTVGKRVRGLESFIQSREKMAALGTLAAGLAHELNNPAAALVRALKDIQPAMLELQRMNLLYGQQQVDDAHTQDWEEIRDRGFEAIAHPVADPLAQSDREDALLDWLEDYGVENAWELAEPLASGHVEPKQLEAVTRPWKDYSNELRDMGIRWLALSFDVMGMVHNGLDGAERISTLVQSMKSYAYMDQAARQCINIHDGLDATLRLFSFKLKQNITVERHYDSDLPVIPAFGSELNQVWTNLIDNAIHALCDQASSGKTAKIIIRTGRHKDCLRVDIEDNGPGIPAEIKTRIMEPFFTTKPMGQGSGLGLDVVRRIVENRHSGSLMIQSEPGRTCFCVLLPLCPDDSER